MIDYLSVHPSLFSHKGTPIRFLITFNSGEKISISPLQYQAAAIAFNNSVSGILPLPIPKGKISIINHAGNVISSFEITTGGKPESIQPFVIYPNGSTWEGEVFENKQNDIAMLVWSWELAHRMSLDDKNLIFGFDKPWYEVPTTVAFMNDSSYEGVCGCVRAHHVCSTCDFVSK